MKEFELTMRLRNNLLKRRRLELGFTPRQLAEQVPLNYGLYLQYEGLKTSPVSLDGSWKTSAELLAAFHGLRPEDLWPGTVLAVNKPEVTTELEAETALALSGYAQTFELPPTPEELLLTAEASQRLKAALGKLDFKKRRVIEARFDGSTLREIGEEFKLSRESIRQVQNRALREARGLAYEDLDEEKRTELLAQPRAPLACPVCAALPGEFCRTVKGRRSPVHKERTTLIEAKQRKAKAE